MGSLVGVALEINTSALSRSKSELRCRDTKDIPGVAEGVLNFVVEILKIFLVLMKESWGEGFPMISVAPWTKSL